MSENEKDTDITPFWYKFLYVWLFVFFAGGTFIINNLLLMGIVPLMLVDTIMRNTKFKKTK